MPKICFSGGLYGNWRTFRTDPAAALPAIPTSGPRHWSRTCARRTAVRLLQAVFLTALIACTAAEAGAQEVIINPKLSAADLSRNEARLLFTMRLQHWSDQQAVTVFVLPDDHPLHSSFAKSILGLFPYQLRRIWDRQLFSGTGQAPILVENETEMLRRVAATPGAIGYLNKVPRDARVQAVKVR